MNGGMWGTLELSTCGRTDGRPALLDHATIERRVVKYSPQLEEAFHQFKRPVWVSGAWTRPTSRLKGNGITSPCLDKAGQTIDFLLTEQCDEPAAKCFLTRCTAATACRKRSPSTECGQRSGHQEATMRSMDRHRNRKIKVLNNLRGTRPSSVKQIMRLMSGSSCLW